MPATEDYLENLVESDEKPTIEQCPEIADILTALRESVDKLDLVERVAKAVLRWLMSPYQQAGLDDLTKQHRVRLAEQLLRSRIDQAWKRAQVVLSDSDNALKEFQLRLEVQSYSNDETTDVSEEAARSSEEVAYFHKWAINNMKEIKSLTSRDIDIRIPLPKQDYALIFAELYFHCRLQAELIELAAHSTKEGRGLMQQISKDMAAIKSLTDLPGLRQVFEDLRITFGYERHDGMGHQSMIFDGSGAQANNEAGPVWELESDPHEEHRKDGQHVATEEAYKRTQEETDEQGDISEAASALMFMNLARVAYRQFFTQA